MPVTIGALRVALARITNKSMSDVLCVLYAMATVSVRVLARSRRVSYGKGAVQVEVLVALRSWSAPAVSMSWC